jgi:putative ABC transport system ATP-binding protein
MSVTVDTAVSARGLVMAPVLAGLDLDVPMGRLTAVAGAPGSGKTTLVNCLGGLERPEAGTVHIGAKEVTALGDAGLTRLRRDRVGFVFRASSLLPGLSVGQNIRVGLELAGRRPDRRWFDTVVGLLGLTDLLGARPSALTGSQCQRVACARAFVNRPDVVFADEPSGDLDPCDAADLLAFLRMWVRKLGQTVVLTTSDPQVAAHADRVLMLVDGRIAEVIDQPTAGAVRAALRRATV